jgi:hypothetical protein
VIESIFPKALVRKEVYLHRWYALSVFLLIIPTLVKLPWAQTIVSVKSGVTSPMPWRLQAVQALQQFVDGGATGSVGIWAAFVVMGYAVMLMYSERQRGSLWYALTTPVSRQQILRVKWCFGFLTLIGVFGLSGLYLFILNSVIHAHIASVVILTWSVTQVVVETGIFTLTMLIAILVSNPVFALGIGYLLEKLPGMVEWVLPDAYYRLIFRMPYNWIFLNWQACITPWSFVGRRVDDIQGWLDLSWFLLLIVLCYAAAQRLFRQMQAERAFALFSLPGMRRWGIGILVAISGLMVVDVLFHQVPKSLKILIFLLFVVCAWRWLVTQFDGAARKAQRRAQ